MRTASEDRKARAVITADRMAIVEWLREREEEYRRVGQEEFRKHGEGDPVCELFFKFCHEFGDAADALEAASKEASDG